MHMILHYIDNHNRLNFKPFRPPIIEFNWTAKVMKGPELGIEN